MILEVFKLLISLTIPAIAALLGFWFACKRDDRGVHQAAILEVGIWHTRISMAASHQESVTLHKESIAALQPSLIKSMVLRRSIRCEAIARALEEYCKVNPNRHPEHNYSGIECRTMPAHGVSLPSFHESIMGKLGALKLTAEDRRDDDRVGGRGF